MKERDTFLTESMLPALKDTKHIPYKFSTWEGFGKLWEWAQKQGWWNSFIDAGGMDCSKDRLFPVAGIHPNRFADALYELLKKCECSLRTRLAGDGCEICNPDLDREIDRENLCDDMEE
jgi:hypothetical protein